MHRWRAINRAAVAALAVLAVAALGGCGRSRHRSPTTTGPGGVAAGYLTIADSANAKVAAAQAHMVDDATDLALVQADLRAIAAAKRAFDGDLRALQVPAGFGDDVQRLLAADETLEGLLDKGASAETTAALSALQGRILAAGRASAGAATALRRDLGLPPTPVPSTA